MVSTKNRQMAQERARKAARSQARRKRLAIGAVAIVLLGLGVLVAIKLTGGGSGTSSTATPTSSATVGSDASALAPTALAALTGVPANVLDQVGAGAVSNPPKAISGQPVLSEGGKPLILYVGAEYCPYCAGQRWAMVVALSRFGTFSTLRQTTSSSSDVFPDTATVTFSGARYTSQYLEFQGVETHTRIKQGDGYTPLDTLTEPQQLLLKTLNAPPYVPENAAGSIPFINFANQAIMSGASYTPEVLAGQTAEQIAAALSDPASPVAKAVVGTANAFTTVLCSITQDQPATVCTSPAANAYRANFE
ncbi:MAG TPA: DUF929 family protein [Micromonosporaceae bacterium]|nr:DUF929 family protein [Micromonosporaceae bacterium]